MCHLSIVRHTADVCGHSMMYRHSCDINNEIVCVDENCQIERYKVSYCCYLCNERFQNQAEEYEKQEAYREQVALQGRKEELERVQAAMQKIDDGEPAKLEKCCKTSTDEDIEMENA